MILLQLDAIDIFRVYDTPYIYARVRACIVIVTLFFVLVGSLYILSIQEEQDRKVVSRDKPRFTDETRERGEKEAGGLKEVPRGRAQSRE